MSDAEDTVIIIGTLASIAVGGVIVWQATQPPPPPTPTVLTLTIPGPSNQQQQYFGPPPAGVVWDVQSAQVTVSTSAPQFSSSSQAYMYSFMAPAVTPWTPNYDNYANIYVGGSTEKTLTGGGGYSATKPSGDLQWIKWDQTLHINSAMQIPCAAQLVAGESATFTLTVLPETVSGTAIPLFNYDSPVTCTGSEVVYKIPDSTPPPGSVFRIENASAQFKNAVKGATVRATIVRQPDGFILCDSGNGNPAGFEATATATGGYSTVQCGPDSGPNGAGTFTVWTAEQTISTSQYLEAHFTAPSGYGGQYGILLTEYQGSAP
jgi:hypothetical protein